MTGVLGFGQVADAYYVLSEAKRRKEYDDLYGSRRPFGNTNTNNGFPGGFSSSTRQQSRPAEEEEDEYDEEEQHEASGNFFKSFAGMFGGGAGATQNEKTEDPLHGGRPDANGVFGDVFEDMYVPPPPSSSLGASVLIRLSGRKGSRQRWQTFARSGATSVVPRVARLVISSVTSREPLLEVRPPFPSAS